VFFFGNQISCSFAHAVLELFMALCGRILGRQQHVWRLRSLLTQFVLFPRIPLHSFVFPAILSHSFALPRIPVYSLAFSSIPWHSLSIALFAFHRIPSHSFAFHRIPPHSFAFPRVSSHSLAFFACARIPSQREGMQWNTRECKGTRENTMDCDECKGM
jgi:hypothetical protein